MGTLFTNEELEQAETLEQKISALISAAHWNGVQDAQLEAAENAARVARQERLMELGRIYATAGALMRHEMAYQEASRPTNAQANAS